MEGQGDELRSWARNVYLLTGFMTSPSDISRPRSIVMIIRQSEMTDAGACDPVTESEVKNEVPSWAPSSDLLTRTLCNNTK